MEFFMPERIGTQFDLATLLLSICTTISVTRITPWSPARWPEQAAPRKPCRTRPQCPTGRLDSDPEMVGQCQGRLMRDLEIVGHRKGRLESDPEMVGQCQGRLLRDLEMTGQRKGRLESDPGIVGQCRGRLMRDPEMVG